MNKAIIGRKLGMTQLFSADGKVIPVTVIEAGPCPVVQVKTFCAGTPIFLNKPASGLFNAFSSTWSKPSLTDE